MWNKSSVIECEQHTTSVDSCPLQLMMMLSFIQDGVSTPLLHTTVSALCTVKSVGNQHDDDDDDNDNLKYPRPLEVGFLTTTMTLGLRSVFVGID